jgi:hypothetical protein
MLTNARTPLEQYMSVAMAVVMQVSAYIFYYLWKRQKGYKILASVGIMVSIFGTICFSINQSNSIRNEQMLESNGFKQMQEAKKLTEDNRNVSKSILDEKKKDSSIIESSRNARILDIKSSYSEKIAEIERTYDSRIKGLEQQKNTLPKDFITKRNELTGKVSVQKSELAQKILLQKSELAQKIEQINTEFDKRAEQNNNEIGTLLTSVVSEKKDTNDVKAIGEKKAERGYVGFSETINNWDIAGTELISLIIAMLLAFAFEYLSMGLFSYCLSIFQLKKNTAPITPPENKKYIPKIESKKENPFRHGIKLVHTNKKPIPVMIVDDEKTKKYIKSMLELAKGDIAPGYLAITRHAKLKAGEGRNIFEALKHQNKIKVIDGKTTIMKGVKNENLTGVC